ncbi:hypothetical protein ACIRBX_35195, partial [Kitasatospora sp. NPDC096147]
MSSTFDTDRRANSEGELEGDPTAVRVGDAGSGPPVTVTTFVGVTVASGLSVPLNVHDADPPTANSTAGQTATPPAIGQSAPPPSARIEAPDTPVGTVSRTTT